MTTITLENSTKIFENKVFKDIFDLANFIVQNNEEKIFLHELKDSEITDELQELANLSRKKDNSEFINI